MTYAEKVREHLDDCIYPAKARLRVFAQELGIHYTTLQDYLQREGTSWRELRREEIIKRIVDLDRGPTLSDSEIADALGFDSKASALSARREAMRRQLTDAPSFLDTA